MAETPQPQEQDEGWTKNDQRQEQAARDAMLPWTITGDAFEAFVALRTMERVFGVLERGDQLGFGWPRIGVNGERADRVFARFRALRDELVELRTLRRPRDTRPDGDMGSSR